MRLYRPVSLLLAGLFAATGLVFLLIPEQVLSLFNTISTCWGMTQSPVAGSTFYVVLAVGYMYVVTVLAFLMFRHPENRTLPVLLLHAKAASSLLSLGFFLFQDRYLIYLTNFVIDGAIAVLVLGLHLKARKAQWASG
jgi:hypothetical protein